MLAIRADAPGGPEVMGLVEVETPRPGAGELLVRVEAAGVNYVDVYQRNGLYAIGVPLRLGLEGAGVVEAVGDGVVAVRPGDRVAWASAQGSYATHAIVASERAVPIPAGLDERSAAALMLQGMTAQYLATSTFPLKKGDACLVHAAAGGVGLLLCQLAKRAGAFVIGTASTPEKAALARMAGADEVVPYRERDFAVEARRLTGGRGVDVVYDSVGRDTFEKSLESLRPRGMLVLFGQSSGPVAPFDPQILNARGSLFFTRPSLWHYTATRDELLARAGDVLGAAVRGELRVTVGATLPLFDAVEAHRRLEARATTGKLLLIP
jgi:NADPH2:quinone reductase